MMQNFVFRVVGCSWVLMFAHQSHRSDIVCLMSAQQHEALSNKFISQLYFYFVYTFICISIGTFIGNMIYR